MSGLAGPVFADNPDVPNCRNCGAPLRIIRDKGLLICDHCGTEQEAPAIPEELELLGETSQACPVCSTPLSQGRLHGHPLLCCPSCAGLLIEHERLHDDHRRGTRLRRRRVSDNGAVQSEAWRADAEVPVVRAALRQPSLRGTGECRDRHLQPVSGELAGPGRAPSHRARPGSSAIVLGLGLGLDLDLD